jgi:hypothetical protein
MQRGPGWDGAGVHGGRGPPGGVRQHKADVFRVPPRPVGESVSAVCVLCGGLCASALSSLCIRPSFPDARAVSIPVPAGHAESYTRQQMGWERKFIGGTNSKAMPLRPLRRTGWQGSLCRRALLELPWAVASLDTNTGSLPSGLKHRTRLTKPSLIRVLLKAEYSSYTDGAKSGRRWLCTSLAGSQTQQERNPRTLAIRRRIRVIRSTCLNRGGLSRATPARETRTAG